MYTLTEASLVVAGAAISVIVLLPLLAEMWKLFSGSQRAGIFRYLWPNREGLNHADRRSITRAKA